MTWIGLHHYGGTLGLYDQPLDEQARALAVYEEAERRSKPKKRTPK